MAMGMMTPKVPNVQQQPQQQPAASPNGQKPWWYADDTYKSGDADLIHAAVLQRYIQGEGGLKGDARAFAGSTNTDVVRGAIEKLRARSAQRKGMNQQIAGMGEELGQEENLLKQEANQALNQGLSGARKNYNRRGLLFSGMREGAEEGIKQNVSNQLGSSIMQARQSSNDLMNKRKAAVASLGLASEKEALAAAEQQFQIKLQSSVARQQAIQQLGSALGQVGGMAYSSMSSGGEEPKGGGGGYAGMSSGRTNQRRIDPRVD